MLRYLFIIFLVLASIQSGAQTKYVSVREGAPVYAARDSSSKIISTLEYGTAVVDTTRHRVQVFFKDYNTWFVQVETDAGKGYVPEIFLLPFPPPKNNVSTVDSYLMQISELLSYIDSLYTTRTGDSRERTHIKKAYKDGFITERDLTWYQHYHHLTIPNIRIQHAYVLMQYFYKEQGFFLENYKYPTRDVQEEKLNDSDTRTIKLYKDKHGNLIRMSITVDNSAVLAELELIQAGNDVIVVQTSSL